MAFLGNGERKMQTNFSIAQLADPDIQEVDGILRKCVHCGFCTATCPTFSILGDELDSPRGRIYLIKDWLENDRPPSERVVTHIDRCLTCLSCMTTCPSGVDYMHLVDQARARIETDYTRPFVDRALRELLAWMLPHPTRFRAALVAAWLARPLAPVVRTLFGKRLGAMLGLAPAVIPPRGETSHPRTFTATGPRRKRVALLTGCAQQVLAPAIHDATVRLLTRHGVEVVVAEGAGCCGALTQHMGKTNAAQASARANIDAWGREMDGEGLDAIIINASGCGTTVKDYSHMLAGDPAYAERAIRIAEIARDVTEFIEEIGLNEPVDPNCMTVTYHSACSMQHGQKIKTLPQTLLRRAGFEVREPRDSHLCCGSAGTYNMLQPDLADELRRRKSTHLNDTDPEVFAAGNLGCMTQLEGALDAPIVHTVELLDWATGGPKPAKLG